MNFDDTEVAFGDRTTAELLRAKRMFQMFSGPPFVRKVQTALARFFLWLHLPEWLHLRVKTVIRRFGFDHFYGGESLEQAKGAILRLSKVGVRSILDYSVEAVETEDELDATCDEMRRAIDLSTRNPHAPFAVFKATGLAREGLLERMSSLLAAKSFTDAASTSSLPLTALDQSEFSRARARMHSLCSAAQASKLRILVDAEHSWFQPAIDWLALQLMQEFNQDQAVVYNTLQMYRLQRLDYLKELHHFAQETRFTPGIKLVRGAYMESERKRAKAMGAPAPIQPSQAATNSAFNAALVFCVDHIGDLALVVGTHNEDSLRVLVERLEKQGLQTNDPRVEIAQLLGMRDNASVLLAAHGYNVCKYVPYGPLREAFPYLTRRAEENTSIQGQVGRELELIEMELRRRHSVR